jgi:hypothetical protein
MKQDTVLELMYNMGNVLPYDPCYEICKQLRINELIKIRMIIKECLEKIA